MLVVDVKKRETDAHGQSNEPWQAKVCVSSRSNMERERYGATDRPTLCNRKRNEGLVVWYSGRPDSSPSCPPGTSHVCSENGETLFLFVKIIEGELGACAMNLEATIVRALHNISGFFFFSYVTSLPLI